MTSNQHDQTRVLYQLCSMICNILGSPPLPIPFPTTLSGPTLASASSSSVAAPPFMQPPRVSTAGFAGLFIVVSFAMMMFGTAIFVIGFMLMPLVVGLVFLFYLAGIVSNLTYLAAAVISPPTRIVSAWRLS
nr:transmembrane protein [Tanacetum cinerariifolium]